MSDASALAAAAYRYDYCTAKYELTNFVGRTLTVSFNTRGILNNVIGGESTTAVTIVVIVSVISLTAIGGYFFLRKRREQN